MDEKEELIADFEAVAWKIDEELKKRLLQLSINQLACKLVDWHNWLEVGQIEFSAK